MCLSVATFSVLRSNFFQKYPWFIVSIEETTNNMKSKETILFLFEKEKKKIQNVISFFEWKTLLDEVDED